MCVALTPCALRLFTYESRGGRVGLDGLLGVALDHVPELPHVAGVKDVEGLVRVQPAALRVRTEQVIVRTGIPLRKREREGRQEKTLESRSEERNGHILPGAKSSSRDRYCVCSSMELHVVAKPNWFCNEQEVRGLDSYMNILTLVISSHTQKSS